LKDLADDPAAIARSTCGVGILSKVALAIFAHPDDAELTCFGTLALLKSLGYRILVAIVTDGLGASTGGVFGDRVEEAENASAIMRFELMRGALPDGDLRYGGVLIAQIERWVVEYRPSIVITHDRDPAGVDHQDHSVVSHAVLNVVQRTPKVDLLLQAEPSRGSRSFVPNVFVDVTEFASKKLAAIACHKSQLNKQYLHPSYVNLRSNWWAASSGALAVSDAENSIHIEAFRLARASIIGSASALGFMRLQDQTEQSRRPRAYSREPNMPDKATWR
jgi:N-acetylglucosamine malate deacetylase 1